MAPLVTVIGDALLDVHVHPSNPMRRSADVPASVRVEPGGQGANLAVRLSRRGVRARLVAAVGEDRMGLLVRDALEADGVDLVGVSVERTGAVVVLLDDAGDRTMLSQRVPFLGRAAVSLDWGSLFETDWLVVSGYALLEPETGLSATGAKPRRLVTGCALEPTQVARWLDAVASLAPHLVVVNHDEARTLVRQTADAASLPRLLADRMNSVVVVTHASGASADVAGEHLDVAADASTAVDTTGAGDAFAAALVVGLLESEWPPSPPALRNAMGAAVALASAVASSRGAQGLVEGERRGGDR